MGRLRGRAVVVGVEGQGAGGRTVVVGDHGRRPAGGYVLVAGPGVDGRRAKLRLAVAVRV